MEDGLFTDICARNVETPTVCSYRSLLLEQRPELLLSLKADE